MRSYQLVRKSVVLLVASLVVHGAIAQIQTTGAGNGAGSLSGTGMSVPGGGTMSGSVPSQQTFMTLSARGGWKLPNFDDIQGSPFLHKDYHNAFVRVHSGFVAQNVAVKFNIYGNEIIFLKNGNEMALDSVDFVSYDVVGKNGTLETIKLKAGFPPIGSNTKNTIYQLLDSGSSVQLLKYYYQKIGEVKSMGTVPAKEFNTYQELYINTPKGGIKKIKADAESLKEALPEYAVQIDKIISEKKLKLKKETDLVQLIAELNTQKAF